MSRQSNFAAIVEREVNKRLALYGRQRMQLCDDAAMIAANEVLGMGKGRAKAFHEAFVNAVNEIAQMVVDDEDELVYSKTKLDKRIKEIVGEENFVPYDERYGG